MKLSHEPRSVTDRVVGGALTMNVINVVDTAILLGVRVRRKIEQTAIQLMKYLKLCFLLTASIVEQFLSCK